MTLSSPSTRIKCTLCRLKDLQVSAVASKRRARNQFLRERKMSSGCCRLYYLVRVLYSPFGIPARISPRTRPREGSFDLWRPAGRFTNIKFAFKGVDGATVERATKATMPRGDEGCVSCVYITLRIYSVVGGKCEPNVAHNFRRR